MSAAPPAASASPAAGGAGAPGAPAALPPIPPNIAALTAPILFGVLFNWALYGILVVQTYLYSYYFADDKRIIKILVYGVFIVETVQTALTGADIYYWFANGFGDLLHLTNPYISPFDTPLLGSVITLVIQTFFCYRIWVLERSIWWWSLFIEMISIVQGTGGFVGAVQGHLHAKFSKAHQSTTPVYLWLVGDAVADFFIAVTMIYLFARNRNKDTQFSGGHYILARIVRLTVETNVVSASVAIISIIVYAVSPNQPYFLLPTAIIGKIYSNTLLVTFNNRISLRDGNKSGNSRQNNSTNQGTGTETYVSRPTVNITREHFGGSGKDAIPLDNFSVQSINPPTFTSDKRDPDVYGP